MSPVTSASDEGGNGTTGESPVSRPVRIAAWAVIGIGALLVVSGLVYLAYAQVARSKLDELEYAVPARVREGWLRPVPQPDAPAKDYRAQSAGPASSGPANGDASTVTRPADQASPGPAIGDASPVPRFDFAAVYPADRTNPKFWARPEWAGTGPYGGPGLPEGFEFVSAYDLRRIEGALAAARRISIPAIGLDATVEELEIIDLGDSRAYETPDNVVGHIPDTANPGEDGNGWFFGHLESPLRGEGNVFRRLPEIRRLAQQDPVDIIIENDDGAFLYRVVATDVVYQDDLSLYDSEGVEVTLVACVPTRVYDHRLLVTAELIAQHS